MNPAAVAAIRLYACGSRFAATIGVKTRDIEWLPTYWWGCICNPLPRDLQVECCLLGLEVILVGLAEQVSEVVN